MQHLWYTIRLPVYHALQGLGFCSSMAAGQVQHDSKIIFMRPPKDQPSPYSHWHRTYQQYLWMLSTQSNSHTNIHTNPATTKLKIQLNIQETVAARLSAAGVTLPVQSITTAALTRPPTALLQLLLQPLLQLQPQHQFQHHQVLHPAHWHVTRTVGSKCPAMESLAIVILSATFTMTVVMTSSLSVSFFIC